MTMYPITPRDPGFIRGGIPDIDWTHPLAEGLTGLWLPGTTTVQPMRNLVTGYPATFWQTDITQVDGVNFPPAYFAGQIGRGLVTAAYPSFPDTGYFWKADASANIYGDNGSFAVCRVLTSTSLSSSADFGDGGGLNCHVPYSDGTVYLDFPTQAQRVTGTYPTSLELSQENWLLSGGTTNRLAIVNGTPVINTTSQTTALSPGSATFTLNKGSQGGRPHQLVQLYATWSRQLNVQEAIAFTLAPLQFLIWPEDYLWAEWSGTPPPPALAPRGWFDAEYIGSKAWFG
jgi:hypothetical protein